MKAIRLANTPVTCSQLAFGCVTLTLHKDPRDAIKLLEHALDQGITHFDVAPGYGMGQAEAILGDFVRTRRDKLTITTKFGIRPNRSLAKHRRLLGVARKVIRWFPALERKLKRNTGAVMEVGNYSAEEARQSLDFSLRQLKTDHIDVLMLHEAMPADAANEELTRFLEDQKSAGKVLALGMGSTFKKFADDAANVPPPYVVLQFENNPVSNTIARLRNAHDRALITYGAARLTGPLLKFAAERPEIARVFGDELGIDPANPASLTGILFRWAFDQNPNGLVLFTSTSAKHITENAAHASAPPLTAEETAALMRYVTAAVPPTAA